MHKLFLDIETLPAGEESHAKLEVLFEKKRKEDDLLEDFLLRTSFDGAFGRIFCIGYAVDDGPLEAFAGDEKKILEDFWELVSKLDRDVPPPSGNYGYRSGYGKQNNVLFVGHNVMDFDMRFIYQRSIVLGVKPSLEVSFARYRSDQIYDTMREWSKWSSSSVGLETLALALDIPSPKEGIDGSQVFDFYKQGRGAEIIEYCKRDVETTRALYQRMVFAKAPKSTLF